MLDKLHHFCRTFGCPDASIVEQKVKSFDGGIEPSLHPYGFFIWKLGASISGFSLRLHVWTRDVRPRQQPDWPPHIHNSDLFSFLLLGEISNYEWDWLSDPAGDQVLYEVRYQGNLSKLEKTNEYGTTTNKVVSNFQQGNYYSVPAARIHASEVATNSTAATLVLVSENTIGNSKVVGSRSGDPSYMFDRNTVIRANHIEAKKVALEGLAQLLR